MGIDNYLDEMGWSMKRDTTCLTYAWLKQAIERQAGISFKAGIKEVVEWSNKECTHDIQELSQSGLCEYMKEMPEKKCECPLCWQAQLKKWGIS